MKDLEQLAKRLKELRLTHELTQEEFAAAAGISYKYYQQIESGRKKQIWLSTVTRLAEAYHLHTWELLTPEFPQHARIKRKATKSAVHYRKR